MGHNRHQAVEDVILAQRNLISILSRRSWHLPPPQLDLIDLLPPVLLPREAVPAQTCSFLVLLRRHHLRHRLPWRSCPMPRAFTLTA